MRAAMAREATAVTNQKQLTQAVIDMSYDAPELLTLQAQLTQNQNQELEAKQTQATLVDKYENIMTGFKQLWDERKPCVNTNRCLIRLTSETWGSDVKFFKDNENIERKWQIEFTTMYRDSQIGPQCAA
ncbi:hypothetical protein DP148_26245 [Salmonella enterica subsp. enterica serovar Typhimurium]|nr:hypothetical protein DP148_26245 [Salmonella enterica subsp. enterica serovar Typhimurium]